MANTFVWLYRRGSTDNFNRKDRLYSTLPANNRRVNETTAADNADEEETVNWSEDEDAVALNGDWVMLLPQHQHPNANISVLLHSPIR